jgi:hypothetical protein
MTRLTLICLIFFAPVAFGQANVGKSGKPQLYNLGAEFQIGYPSVKLTNPNGKDAIYDGVGIRGNLNVPIYIGPADFYFSVGGKYLDLNNLANNSDQVETANVIGIGAGLTVNYRYFQFGTKYVQEWGRHFSSGSFSSRTNYNLAGLEYFGGLYFKFDRLGVGLTYSNQISEIDRSDTGLESNTPYNESLVSLQFTFDMGESLWQLLGRLF